MNITREWLDEKQACRDGKDWFAAQDETDGVKVVEKLMAEKRLDWANWLIVRIMESPQYLAYAIYAADAAAADADAAAAAAAYAAAVADDAAAAAAADAAAAAYDAREKMMRRILTHGLSLLKKGA